ncbi:hypothetical protein K9L97_00035 [Candidatus Woesearchaeota archaeon]|nr:hypothetical protein [Candidatus Woesearchaeota archaeon]
MMKITLPVPPKKSTHTKTKTTKKIQKPQHKNHKKIQKNNTTNNQIYKSQFFPNII